MDYGKIGLRMKQRREELDLTLTEVGKRTGNSASVVSRWENGDIKSLKTTKLRDIAEALDTSVEYLLGLHETFTPLPGLRPVANTQKGDLSVIVKDQAMINARIYPTDEVFIDSQAILASGDLAAVYYNDEIIIRRIYHYPGRIELRSENPIFETINIEGKELTKIKIIGKAIALLGVLK